MGANERQLYLQAALGQVPVGLNFYFPLASIVRSCLILANQASENEMSPS